MPAPKNKKQIKEFNDHLTDILLSHGIVIPEESKEGLFMSMASFYKDYKEPKIPTAHWQDLVDGYFQFYESITGFKPSFTPAETRGLKGLSNILMKRFIAGGKKKEEWTKEIAVNRHIEFYKLTCQLQWVKSHFSVAYLYNSFDRIVSELTAMFKKEEQTKNKLLSS